MTGPTSESEIEVHLDRENTRAELVLAPGLDPSTIDPGFVRGMLRERGVAIDQAVESQLDALVATPASESATRILVAEWSPPRHGRDGGVQWRDGFEPVSEDEDPGSAAAAEGEAERAVAAIEADVDTSDLDDAEPIGEDGDGDVDETVDHYNQRRFRAVNAGDHLGDLVRATEGEDGRDVTGATVPARPGRRLEPRPDEESIGVDGDRIVAKVPGIVRLEGNRLWIQRHLEIEASVDFNTGNIDFDGAVTVGDAVKDRFVVRATGDVAVLGLVEGATLMVGGQLWLRRGMAAKERGQILVDGIADVGFLNNVRGRIRGDLIARREVIDCEMVVGGRLIGPRSAVIGGQIAVTGTVEIAVIGSGGGAVTRVVLGEVPLLGAAVTRIDDLSAAWRKDSKAKRDEADSIEHGETQPGPAERARIDGLREEAMELDRRIDAGERRREKLLDEIKAAMTVDLVVNRRIFPKTELVVGGRTFVVTEEIRGPVRIEADEKGTPVVTSEGREPRPIFDFVEERKIAA